ncbi:MAG: hypothetical protein E6927_25940 [Klebsiella michiganensis]|nr:hypothetical protein [Klebsiella michiganensis]
MSYLEIQLLSGVSGGYITLFWIDHHDFVRSTLSEEIFATNREQLDALIEHLQEYRNQMPTPPGWMSEK